MNVKKHGTGSIGVIRYKNLSLGQVPDKPGVHRAEQQLARLRHFPGALHIIQDPLDLGTGKIGIRHQPGPLPDDAVKAILLQLFDNIRRPAALPADGIVHRFSRFFTEADGSLPLVGNTYRRNILNRRADFSHGLHSHTQLGGPDFQRVMLHPARFRIYLGELPLHHRAHMP